MAAVESPNIVAESLPTFKVPPFLQPTPSKCSVFVTIPGVVPPAISPAVCVPDPPRLYLPVKIEFPDAHASLSSTVLKVSLPVLYRFDLQQLILLGQLLLLELIVHVFFYMYS